MSGTNVRWLGLWGIALLCSCTSNEARIQDAGVRALLPAPGDTEFVSVDAERISFLLGRTNTARVVPNLGDLPELLQAGSFHERLSDQRILSVNRYRGVQLLDLSDPDAPRIEGTLTVQGEPAGLYVIGDVAYVLLTHHLQLAPDRLGPSSVSQLLRVDISDRTRPSLRDEVAIPGEIRTSHLAGSSLHVVVSDPGEASSRLITFATSEGSLTEQHQRDLGRDLSTVRFTSDSLLTARVDTSTRTSSVVSLIALSAPDAAAAEVTAHALVRSTSQLEVRGDTLRVVSSGEPKSTEGFLEIFDIRGLQRLSECSFDRGRSAVFTERAAFMYSDDTEPSPVNVFAIDEAGRCERRDGLAVQSDAALKATGLRLFAITAADESLEVSMYAVDDSLHMVAQQNAPEDARVLPVYYQTDRAAVFESNGPAETGLLIVPFEGRHNSGYVQGLQLFSFSDNSLTRRGHALVGTTATRAFSPSAGLAASLTPTSLSLHDVGTASDEPVRARGRLELSANDSSVFVYGDHIVRAQTSSRFSDLEPLVSAPPTRVEVLDPAVIATLELPAAARLRQVGDLLVSVSPVAAADWKSDEPVETSIEVYDLRDPAHPTQLSTFTSERLAPVGTGYRFFDRPSEDLSTLFPCTDCSSEYGNHIGGIYALGKALVFTERTSQSESLGWWQQCRWRPHTNTPKCPLTPEGEPSCWYKGERVCAGPEGKASTCSGEIERCTVDGCEPTTLFRDVTDERCTRQEQLRRWSSYRLQVLDLSEPAQPRMLEPIELAPEDHGTSILAAGDKLYINYQRPIASSDDTPLIRRYVRTLQAGAPKLSAEVNVPGEILSVDGDVLITRDRVWNDRSVETIAARVKLGERNATLTALHPFGDRQIMAALADGSGHVLVEADPGQSEEPMRFSLLSASDLTVERELDTEIAGTLTQLAPGKILITRMYQLTILDTRDTQNVHATHHLASTQTDRQLARASGDRVLIATGLHGIETIDFH